MFKLQENKVTKKILDLGCGNRKKPGAIGIDCNPKTCADVVHDLNIFPYPFENASFDEIYADNILEHLNDLIAVMEELFRISRSGAIIKINVPYFRSKWAFIDPTHKHFFTTESFTYFDPLHIHHKLFPYSSGVFLTERVVFNEKIKEKGFLGKIKELIKKIANKFPQKYESCFSQYFPLDELSFYLKAVK